MYSIQIYECFMLIFRKGSVQETKAQCLQYDQENKELRVSNINVVHPS